MDEWPDFKSVDLVDLYKRLLLATEGRLRRLWWGGASELHAGDFVHDAIQKAMKRQRKWDRTKSLYQNLWQIVSSEISHAAESYENKNVGRIDDAIIQIKDYRDNPEETAIDNSQIKHLLSYLNSNDADSAVIGDLIINKGIAKSIALSVLLKRPVPEIENIKKRLRRLCKNYQEEQMCKTPGAQIVKLPRRGDL